MYGDIYTFIQKLWEHDGYTVETGKPSGAGLAFAAASLVYTVC